MVRSPLLLLPLVGLLGAWVGGHLEAAPARVSAIVAGLGAMLVVDALQRRRLRQLSTQVNAWMGKVEVQPLQIRGGHDTQAFASALNALGAAYARRGLRVKESDPRLRSLIQALPEPAMLFDDDLTLLAANEGAEALFVIADGPTTATQALGSAVLAELVRLTVEQPQLHRAEARVGERTIEASTTPFAGKVLLLARDHTLDVRLEALRRDFVANASHELKSPVAGIQSLTDAIDVVLDRDLEKARHLVSRVRGEADRLASLVSDLLSLRRVDERISGEAVEHVRADHVVREVVADLLQAPDHPDVEVTVQVLDEGHLRVVQEDLRLVVSNLVGNAIKYNRPDGQVVVRLERAGMDVILSVEDTGIGIPGKDLGRIFERFHRVDEGRSRDAGGTGLGLSIVRHAVERNGGHVTVKSLLGQGTTFRVTLPAVGEEQAPGPGR